MCYVQILIIKPNRFIIKIASETYHLYEIGTGKPVKIRRRLTPTVIWTKTADATDVYREGAVRG